ncbi:hypothetical protein [Phytohabitans houttuyneae]|uniref:DUF2273 domain-containing protein n=1 Tax=Phytohabitans houttuyneae TaxID=1076126 RepID=A0A6V8KUA4_9ACTN|nr:hypothetical protein [Phytohabitans houttuyneae]GFJ86278.1 hypothetical protein Phou_104580 [Phytohabitans houttuyneae]
MSRQQFAFAIGFAVVAVWAAAGFGAAVAAVLAGVAGFMIARVLDGQVDVGELMDRIGARSHRSPR